MFCTFISYRDHVLNITLYGSLQPISSTLHSRRLQFAGHCYRSVDELIHSILFFEPPRTFWLSGHTCKSYVKTLLHDSSLHSVINLLQVMASHDEWRVVCAGIDVDSIAAT